MLGLAAFAAAAAVALVAAPSAAVANAGFNTSLARLASLTNYRFTNIATNDGYKLEMSGLVHGPRDWQINATVPLKESTYDINGHGYSLALGHVIPVTFKTPEGRRHLDGEYSAAQGLIGYTHVAGMRISNKGSCKVAGLAGARYFLQTPRVDRKLLVETVSACIAKRSGALLSYDVGVPSGSQLGPLHAQGMRASFTVTAIGHVGVIRAPRAHAATAAG